MFYFPVYTDSGWVERPYYYCEGGLFNGNLSFYGPRVSFSLNF